MSDEQNTELVIVSREKWEKVQEIRESRKKNMKDARDDKQGKYVYTSSGQLVLMGLVYCGYCGKRLTNGSSMITGKRKRESVGRNL